MGTRRVTAIPDDPNDYSEGDPTQYANYGGAGGQAYSEYSEYSGPAYDQTPTGYPPPPDLASTRRLSHRPPGIAQRSDPASALLTAALLALLIYAIVSFTNAGSSAPRR